MWVNWRVGKLIHYPFFSSGLTFFYRNLIKSQFLYCWVPLQHLIRNSCSQFTRLALGCAFPRVSLTCPPWTGWAGQVNSHCLSLRAALAGSYSQFWKTNCRPLSALLVIAAGWKCRAINHNIIILRPKWSGIFLLKMVIQKRCRLQWQIKIFCID